MKIKFDRFAIKAFVLKLWRDLLTKTAVLSARAYFIDKTACLQMATVQLEGLICDSTARASP